MLLLLLLIACKGPDTDLVAVEADSRVVEVPASVGEGVRLLRLSWPAEPRHEKGAPMLVVAPGGWDPGEGRLINGWDSQGWVSVVPILPGGSIGQLTAEGDYDHRGEGSVQAFRDALRYAAGQLPDAGGTYVSDALPLPLSQAPLTVVGLSNGANLALASLADLPGVEVGALVENESPVGDQFANMELNHNPYYELGTCAPTTCPWPGLTEALALDPSDATMAAGFSEEDSGIWPGRLYLDEDGDGQRGDLEKTFKRMVLGDDGELLFSSMELSEALAASGLGLPPWLASPEQVQDFWAVRDGSLHVPAVAAAYPELVVILQGSAEDHFQTPEDHPHLLAHHQGWLDAGHTRVRLNPDAAYLALVSGQDASLFPDCPMGEPHPWPDLEDCLVPETLGELELDEVALHGAILEAVDRVEHQEFAADLDGVL